MHTCTDHQLCINRALKRAETVCRDKGLQFTALRRGVLEIIWESHAPIKAYDILDKLKKESASAKPPTVYRTLDFLLHNELIHKLNSLNAYTGCSHPRKHSECYFLICEKCGEIRECQNSNLTKAIASTAGKNKFTPGHTTLEIQGQCRECTGRTSHGRADRST